MDAIKLDTLKEKLRTSKKFSDIINFFFDEIDRQPGFMKLGEVIEHPFLTSVITQVGAQCFSGNVIVTALLLTRLPEQQFIHGGCMINGQPGTMIYFEDIQMGLFTLAIQGKETKFARFSGKPYPHGVVPSPN
jgi:hypothetical protein